MVNLSVTKGLKHFSLIALASLIIYGCGSTPKRVTAPSEQVTSFENVDQSSDYYLTKANRAKGEAKQAYLLKALRAAMRNGQLPSQVQQLLERLNSQTMLSDNNELEWQLLHSQHLINGQQPSQALAVLNPHSQWQVTPQRWITYYQHLAKLQHQQSLSLPALDTLDTAITHSEIQEQKNQLGQLIWLILSNLSSDELANYSPTSYQMTGWKSLSVLTKASMQSPDTLRQLVTQWALDNTDHMAVDNLPQNLVAALTISAYQPTKIALLLPLSGRYARLGKAVQHGIVSNLLAHNTEQELISFDTSTLGAAIAHQQAIEQGAEFIIGPLLKNNVLEVASLETNVPTLLLNKVQQSLNDDQFSFALDKEAETIQGAEFLFNQGRQTPVIVAPNNAQGHKLAKLFNQKWLELNQQAIDVKPIEAFYFDSDALLKETIEGLFETDRSQKRINHMRLLVGSSMLSETHSRRDIDAIYLIANPRQTGMLMPSVEVTVSASAPQVAVYVGSGGNNNLGSAQDVSHLNKLTVSDMPWFIQKPAQLSPQYIQKLWPEIKQSHLRLFAMGYDSYALISRLAQMKHFPEFNLEGFSGTLSLGQESDIIRKMAWAQYRRGKLIQRK